MTHPPLKKQQMLRLSVQHLLLYDVISSISQF